MSESGPYCFLLGGVEGLADNLRGDHGVDIGDGLADPLTVPGLGLIAKLQRLVDPRARPARHCGPEYSLHSAETTAKKETASSLYL